MIQHIVLLNVAETTPKTELTAIWSDLLALRDVVDGITDMHFGADVSAEGFGRGYTHGFTILFRDTAARDAYLVHPDHQAAGARLVAALEGGPDGLLVVDLEV